MKKITIAVLHHSINIGNHFFELSIIHDLQKVFKDEAEIIPVEGRHFYSDLTLAANKKYYLNYGIYTKCDYFVLAGPIFQYITLRKNFEPLFKEMQNNGTQFIYLSAGSSHYTNEEIADVRKFLNEYPPFAISTRDRFTYDVYHDLAKFSHDGICSAFFSSFHYSGYDTPKLGKYMILNFEEGQEPNLNELNFNNYCESIFSAKNINCCSKSSKVNILKSMLLKYPDNYNGIKLIRTLHNFNPSIMKPFIHRNNQFVSVNAYAYLNLFSRAEIVLARRVHACVPALSYGKPAMLFNPTKRVKLFDRVELSDITKKPVILPNDILLKEYNGFVSFLNVLKQAILNK
ncbi:polysaccharide pyruvyl transferase family protein [Mariniphaga sp.]|uniref:polysaccharide pyruvyl transferase family protein n=1 Tax=Mariniphaga sp. TaxID=1954475 RepID=UPI0035631B62